MPRAKFERKRGVLIDRTRCDHTTFIHPAPKNATEDALAAIRRGDYGTVVPLLSTADLAPVRAGLLDAARAATHLERNLAQALALIGGVGEVRILRTHLANLVATPLAPRSEEEQLRLVYIAHALLPIRPSLVAARVLVDAIEGGTPWVREVTARLVSEHILAKTTVRVERMLLPVLRTLLSADDRCFASAFPALLQRHFGEAGARCRKLLSNGDPNVRRSLLHALMSGTYHGLPLLVDAFRQEDQLDLRLMIARNVAPVLAQQDLAALIKTALDDESPTIRLDAARLLQHLDSKVARKLARRRDPEPEVDRQLEAFRNAVP